jgi:hypothetical protein
LYQVDHRSYLLDFRNLNHNTDGHHSMVGASTGCARVFRPVVSARVFSLSLSLCVCVSVCPALANVDEDTEPMQVNHSFGWDFADNEQPCGDTTVSEVMEFFEMAASLIRTLAPDSTPVKTSPTATSAGSS